MRKNDMKPKVAILMLTHNAPRYVMKSIWTLRKKTSHNVPYELVVVDNGSKFLTRILVRVLHFFGYIDMLLCNRENLMFARGNNRASSLASPDATHYCLLNSDVEIRNSNWLEVLLGHIGDDVGIASFGAVDSDPIRADGWCMMIRRELYDRFHLDEGFDWFWSVTKIQAKVRELGFSVLAIRHYEEIIHHFGGKSRVDLTKKLKGMDIDRQEVIAWFSAVKGGIRVIDHL